MFAQKPVVHTGGLITPQLHSKPLSFCSGDPFSPSGMFMRDTLSGAGADTNLEVESVKTLWDDLTKRSQEPVANTLLSL